MTLHTQAIYNHTLFNQKIVEALGEKRIHSGRFGNFVYTGSYKKINIIFSIASIINDYCGKLFGDFEYHL